MVKKVLAWIAFAFMMLTIGLFVVAILFQDIPDAKAMAILLLMLSVFFIGGIIGIIVGEKKKIISGILLILAGLATLFLGFMCCVSGTILTILGIFIGFNSCVFYIISAVLFFVTKKGKNEKIK